MSSLLLEPHNDDAALFAAFTCRQERPHIVTVLRSYKQESYRPPIFYKQREKESFLAALELGCDWTQIDTPDHNPEWDVIRAKFEMYATGGHSRIFAPLPEDGGHEHHNRIGELAEEVFGAERVSFYVTYVNGRQRNPVGRVVEPQPGDVAAKLRALACFESQCDATPTRHHFMAGLEERMVP